MTEDKLLLRDICTFVRFLRGTAGLDVSFGAYAAALRPFFPILLQYEIHRHPYCGFIKCMPALRDRCIAQKKKTAALDTPSLTYGCCYAGVEEYINEVRATDGTLIVHIHVSGYRATAASASKHRHVGEKYGISDPAFDALYTSLNASQPDPVLVRQAICPFTAMFRALYAAAPPLPPDKPGESRTDALYREAVTCLCHRYAEPLTAESIAAELFVSESYLRHVFRQKSGVTLSQYLRDVRLTQSRHLLLYTSLPIAEIAQACGFCDAEYFSAVFRRHVGVAPTVYRHRRE